MFALWPVARARRRRGGAGGGARLAAQRAGGARRRKRVRFADEASFANLNTPEEFAQAEARAKMLEAGEPAPRRPD